MVLECSWLTKLAAKTHVCFILMISFCLLWDDFSWLSPRLIHGPILRSSAMRDFTCMLKLPSVRRAYGSTRARFCDIWPHVKLSRLEAEEHEQQVSTSQTFCTDCTCFWPRVWVKYKQLRDLTTAVCIPSTEQQSVFPCSIDAFCINIASTVLWLVKPKLVHG